MSGHSISTIPTTEQLWHKNPPAHLLFSSLLPHTQHFTMCGRVHGCQCRQRYHWWYTYISMYNRCVTWLSHWYNKQTASHYSQMFLWSMCDKNPALLSRQDAQSWQRKTQRLSPTLHSPVSSLVFLFSNVTQVKIFPGYLDLCTQIRSV